MGKIVLKKNPKCPVDESHRVKPIVISKTMAYYFCEVCREDILYLRNRFKKGMFFDEEGEIYVPFYLHDHKVVTAAVIGKKGVGKTEVVSSLIQKQLELTEEDVKIYILDQNDSYSDLIKSNGGLNIKSPNNLNSILATSRISPPSNCLVGISGQVLLDPEKQDKIMDFFYSIVTDPHRKKVLVVDFVDYFCSVLPKFYSFLSEVILNCRSFNCSVILVNRNNLTEELDVGMENLLLFEHYPNKRPNLKENFMIPEDNNSKLNQLGTYLLNENQINYLKIAHVFPTELKLIRYERSKKR